VPHVKSTSTKTYRMISPNQSACFLDHISAITLDAPTASTDNVQSQFEQFHNFAVNLLNHFYPLRTISVTSHNPNFVTPVVKAKLLCKNAAWAYTRSFIITGTRMKSGISSLLGHICG